MTRAPNIRLLKAHDWKPEQIFDCKMVEQEFDSLMELDNNTLDGTWDEVMGEMLDGPVETPIPGMQTEYAHSKLNCKFHSYY